MEKTKKFINENIFYLFYLYALSSALSISASTIILMLFLLFYILDIKNNIKKSPKDFLIFLIIYIWKMFTLIFNGIFSIFSSFINIWDKIPYFSVSTFKIKEEKIIKFFEIIFWINSIIIIYALLQKYLGFPEIVKPLFTSDLDRFKGFFSHPLRFAGYLSMVTIFSFVFAIFYPKKFIKFIPFLMLGVFLTGSRSYFISVIFSTLIISYLKSKKIFSVYAISLIIYSLLIILIFPNIKNRISTSITTNQQSSASLRFNFWKAGFNISSLSPIYGIGDGKVSDYLLPYKEKNLIDNTAHCHNSYITILAENGIIGLAIFIWLFFYFIKKYFLIYKKNSNILIKTFSLGLSFSFVNLSIAGIFESHFSTFIIWSFLTFLMGLFHSYYQTSMEGK